jgi:dynein heavy chain
VQERRKFGPLGWNIRYAFDESDFETSVAVLKRFLTEQDIIPWDAINFATGHINYGGRVTDDWDRRTLMGILGIFMVTDILEDSYAFSKSGTYYAPVVGSKKDMMEYFEQLPHSDDPEVFGMHDNANVTFNTNESLILMESILTLQPRASGGGGGKGPDEQVIDLAEVFESEAPDILDTETEAGETTFIIQPNGLLPSLAICLEQEIVKFNRLMNKMRSSLRDVKRAIRGMIVMSADLDDMYASFMNNKVPPIWEKVSFASLKTLASWVRDMVSRVAFMRLWLVNGQPATFPLPVFFFPQGFMTASLQTFARKHMEAIDGLSFEFEVLRNGLQPELITEGPEDGVIVHGLFMEGARFDHETWKVADSQPGKMYDLLPAIYFKPAVNHKQAPNTYACPVYKTAVRKGVLSTTGMSTNFVVPVEMPINTNETEQKYILAGCAAILNLTD